MACCWMKFTGCPGIGGTGGTMPGTTGGRTPIKPGGKPASSWDL